MSNTAALPIYWPNLVRALQNRECILVLEPEAATLSKDGKDISLQSLLVEFLIAELKLRHADAALLERPNLPYVAKTLEDAIFAAEVLQRPSYSRENARIELNKLIAFFYDPSPFFYSQQIKLLFVANQTYDDALDADFRG